MTSCCCVGKAAPDFCMESTKKLRTLDQDVKLADYRGKWLVLLFYPLNFTFVCPTEITSFSDHYQDFIDLRCEVLGISCDSKYSHQRWIMMPRSEGGLGDLRFPLADDRRARVSRAYGVFDEEGGMPMRSLFIIDDKGMVRYQVTTDNSVGRSVGETLRVLQALQTGKLCPIDWKPGQGTL